MWTGHAARAAHLKPVLALPGELHRVLALLAEIGRKPARADGTMARESL
jgi:hypothetical protein